MKKERNKKIKAISPGKWANSKTNPLDLKGIHNPVKTLGVHFSFDKKGNEDLNFSLKLESCKQTWTCGVLEASRYLVES